MFNQSTTTTTTKKTKYNDFENDFKLDLVLNSEEGGDLSDFITNGEWHLIGEYIFEPIIGI